MLKRHTMKTMEKLLIFKSGIIVLLMLLRPSTQISISNGINSENSLIKTTNRTGCIKTFGQCLRKTPNALLTCAIERALNNVDCLISSNATWQLNEYISFKKNTDWKPIEHHARQQRSMFESVMDKVGDLISSRSVQFIIPDDVTAVGDRKKPILDGFSGLSNFAGSGRKKKLKHGGLMGGSLTFIAMIAQLFLGKIAFLAGASLILSKIALLFSVVNAFKKHGESASKSDHVVYDQGHGGYQRSIDITDFKDMPPEWQTSIPVTFDEHDLNEK